MREFGARSVQRVLGALALGQVEDVCHTLVSGVLKGRHTDEHGHAAAVFPKVLLLERLQGSAHFELGHPVSFVAITPFRRSQVSPVQATRDEIVTVVSHHGEKRVVRLENPPVDFPDEDPDDVGIDEAPDPRFAFGEIAIQARILERDRGLRGEQLQHRGARRREDARGEVVLEVEHADEFALVRERQAEH